MNLDTMNIIEKLIPKNIQKPTFLLALIFSALYLSYTKEILPKQTSILIIVPIVIIYFVYIVWKYEKVLKSNDEKNADLNKKIADLNKKITDLNKKIKKAKSNNKRISKKHDEFLKMTFGQIQNNLEGVCLEKFKKAYHNIFYIEERIKLEKQKDEDHEYR